MEYLRTCQLLAKYLPSACLRCRSNPDGSSMARRRLVDGSKMARRWFVKVIGFLRPCKSATLRSHYPSPKAVPTSLCPSSTQAPELGYTLGRVCEICSEHYTCRLACPRLNDSGSKENLRHNCATIVRVLRHNCSAVAQQSPTNHFFFSSSEEIFFERRGKSFRTKRRKSGIKALLRGVIS